MDRSLDRSLSVHQGLENTLIEIEDGIPVLTSKVCRKCGKEFSDTNGRVQYCSDECRSIAKEKRIADATRRSRETNKGARKKLDKCSTPKCKNKVSRELPDGTPVCRTCLAKHNVYGGVDMPSPTTPHTGKGHNSRGKTAGLAYRSTREEEMDARIDSDHRWREVLHNRRKRWFAVAKKTTGKDGGTKAFKDFRKDSGANRRTKK